MYLGGVFLKILCVFRKGCLLKNTMRISAGTASPPSYRPFPSGEDTGGAPQGTPRPPPPRSPAHRADAPGGTTAPARVACGRRPRPARAGRPSTRGDVRQLLCPARLSRVRPGGHRPPPELRRRTVLLVAARRCLARRLPPGASTSQPGGTPTTRSSRAGLSQACFSLGD